MSIHKLQQLARDAVYEPNRGCEDDDAPEPVRGEGREMLARLDGKRLFYATDDAGELASFGIMERGGEIQNLAVGIYARVETADGARFLKLA